MGYADFEELGGWVGCFFIILYILALINIVKVFYRNISPGAAFGWILFHLLLPMLAVPLYFFLGESKVPLYTKIHRRMLQKFYRTSGRNLMEGLEQKSISHPLGQMLPKIDPLSLVQTAHVKLLVDGEEAFPEMFEAIKKAQHFILVQYYIIRNDRLGLELKKVLCEKAEAGVTVFLLADDWGSFGLGRKYMADLRKCGVHVERFLPFKFRFSLQVNFRNHRKLTLIDGKVAFTGGLNIGVEYLSRVSKKVWRDTHVKVEGQGVWPLIAGFVQDWYFAAGEDIRDKVSFDFECKGGNIPVQVSNFGPTDGPAVGVVLYQQLIASAEKTLCIATPYLVPDEILMHALYLAVLRGVKIRILLPKVGDSFVVHKVSLFHAKQLDILGVEIYLYTPGFMHQKVWVVDDQVAAIGTVNFDNRSLYLNFETALVMHSAEFSYQVTNMLEDDFGRSERFVYDADKVGVVERFSSRFLRLLSPLL